MRFLADHDVYAVTIRFLADAGHDVARVADLGLATAPDVHLLMRAQQDQRILITRDRDFGNLVFIGGTHAGVIYLRIDPAGINAVHAELGRVLTLYGEPELLHAFVVVEPARHRVRRLAP